METPRSFTRYTGSQLMTSQNEYPSQNPPRHEPHSSRQRRIISVGGPPAAPDNGCGTTERGVFSHGHSHRSDAQPSTTKTTRQPSHAISSPPANVLNAGPAI